MDSSDNEPDPVIKAYMKDVDRTLLRENLKLTVTQRFEKHQAALRFVLELRKAGRKQREAPRSDEDRR